jgi:hypothetical protein
MQKIVPAIDVLCLTVACLGATTTPTTTASAPATLPAFTASDMIARARETQRLLFERVKARGDLSADDRAALQVVIEKCDAAAKELLATLPPNADLAAVMSKCFQLARTTQTLLEPRRDLALLVTQESHGLAAVNSDLSSIAPAAFLTIIKQAGLSERAQTAADQAVADFQTQLAAAKRDAEKLAANPAVKSDPAKMQALYLQHTTNMELLALRAALSLEANLPPADLQALHLALILRAHADPFYVTFSTGSAPVPAPLAGTYQLRRIKAEGADTLDTLTLPKDTPLSFQNGQACAGDKKTAIGEGLLAWVLVNK